MRGGTIKLLFVSFSLLWSTMVYADTPIDLPALSAARSVANNIIIQHTYTTMSDGSVVDSVAAKWSVQRVLSDGSLVTTKYCSITLVSEFLTIITGNPMMLSLALVTTTPNGWLVSWNAAEAPPSGINPWCIQE